MPILHWLTREHDLHIARKAPYRLLEEVQTYGAADTRNMLIQGDNLDALKALLPYYAGKVKCVYIDPPYNTKSAFEHYDDNLEHTVWLAMMYPRLELLRELLSEDGSIWVNLDDNEAHYLKIVMDEIFGRKNFIANVVWQKKHTRANDAKWFSDNHDHILIFAKNNTWLPNYLERDKANVGYNNPDNDPRGIWASGPCHVKTPNEKDIFEVITPSGRKVMPPAGTSWRFKKSKFLELIADNRIYFGETGNNIPRYKRFLTDVQDGIVPLTIWSREEVGDNQESKTEIKSFNAQELFTTPKPERLIQRILHIATNPDDLVLDSFLGSGTTAAVAHKVGRRYIGIEIGEHALTHCIPRLQKVMDGEQGGISKAVNWQGGGGFRFYRLGEPIFAEDGSIRPGITFAQLAAHVWFAETGIPLHSQPATPLLGVHDGTAYYLLFNGILKDKRAHGGNVLTQKILNSLPPHVGGGPRTIYGERSLFGATRLKEWGITFKQTPYDIKGR